MKRSHRVIIASLTIATAIMCVIILWILLFKQSAVPQFTVKDGLNGYDGKDGYTPQFNKDYFNGADGKSAYAIWLGIGHTGTEQDFINSLRGDSIRGQDGKNGSSCTTNQLENGATIMCTDGSSSVITNGVNGADGKTPMLQCNTNKNRWEIRYSTDEAWKVNRDQNGNPVPCKAPTL